MTLQIDGEDVGVGLEDITYADLVTAIGGSTLTPGGLYRITDFRTTHYIVDSAGTRSPNQAQIDTVTLTGASGTATIDGNSRTTWTQKTVTFATDLATAAANFVTANAAYYAGIDITLTQGTGGNTADLIFTSTADGDGYHHVSQPIIAVATGDLAGTVVNTQMNGYIVGPTEPLIVTALAANKIGHEAKSETYPQDIIHYDWNPDNWLNDLSFADAESSPGTVIITGFKGVITFRHDTLLDNYAPGDWRNCKSRRWKIATAGWAAANSYVHDDYVTYSNVLYRASIARHNEKQIDTVTLTAGTDGTADMTGAGGLTKTITFNTSLTQTATDFVHNGTTAADYDAVGITIDHSGADITFTAKVAGTGFTSPVVGNPSVDLAGTTANTQANVLMTAPGTDTTWISLFTLSVSEYLCDNPTSTNGITSGVAYQDFKTFSEGTGNATYEKQCRSNHFEGVKDDYANYVFCGSLLGNNVFYLLDETSYTVYANTIASSFYNTIGNYFNYNIIGNYFNYNIIGNFFSNNTIGNNFYSNTIGNTFASNTIGNNFVSNIIGNSFGHNTIGNYVVSNTIGNNFTSNTIGNNFGSNTIRDNFQMNTVEDNFYHPAAGIDFTSATHVYNGYNCTLYVRPDDTQRLRYYNDSDTLVVVAANA